MSANANATTLVCRVCKEDLPDQFVIMKAVTQGANGDEVLLSVSQGGGSDFEKDNNTRVLTRLNNEDTVIEHYRHKQQQHKDNLISSSSSSSSTSTAATISQTNNDNLLLLSDSSGSSQQTRSSSTSTASSRSSRTSRKERLCETCCSEIEKSISNEIRDEEECLAAYMALEKQLDECSVSSSSSSSSSESNEETNRLSSPSSSHSSSSLVMTSSVVTAFDIAEAVGALNRQTQLFGIAQRRANEMIRTLSVEANRWCSNVVEQRKLVGELYSTKDKV